MGLATKVIPDADNLAGAIVAFGAAATVANLEMSQEATPMVIREFYFGVNFAADFVVTNDFNIKLSLMGRNIEDRMHMGYAEHMGLSIKCTMVPLSILTAEAAGIDISREGFDSEDNTSVAEGAAGVQNDGTQ